MLVTGGAGAVGHYGIQLAKWGGARVIATVSSAAKAEQARLAGADLVINYRTEDVVDKAMAPRRTRRRPGGRCRFRRQRRVKLMEMNSTIAIYATNGNRTPRADARPDGKMHRGACAGAVRTAAGRLAACAGRHPEMARGRHTPAQHRAPQFPLSDTAQAHVAVEKGDKLGTVIVRHAASLRRCRSSAEGERPASPNGSRGGACGVIHTGGRATLHPEGRTVEAHLARGFEAGSIKPANTHSVDRRCER